MEEASATGISVPPPRVLPWPSAIVTAPLAADGYGGLAFDGGAGLDVALTRLRVHLLIKEAGVGSGAGGREVFRRGFGQREDGAVSGINGEPSVLRAKNYIRLAAALVDSEEVAGDVFLDTGSRKAARRQTCAEAAARLQMARSRHA